MTESQRCLIYWGDTLIGFVTDPAWSDFPWVYGRYEPTDTESAVREMLQWFHDENKRTDDPCLDQAPFPEHYWEDWFIEKPDGTRSEISPPIPDFDTGFIEWR